MIVKSVAASPVLSLRQTFENMAQVVPLICAIAEGRPAEPDFAFGHKITQTIDAVLTSIAERRWVHIHEV